MTAAGAFRHEFSFESEPGESRWILQHKFETKSHRRWFEIDILEFPDAFPHQPDHKGTRVFSAECAPDAFALAILRTAEKVWDEYGADGYNKIWRGQRGFPIRALKALATALSIDNLPPPPLDEEDALRVFVKPE